MNRKERIAVVGGGVIGAGWAARFLLMGHDVHVYDPRPETHRIVHEVFENACEAYSALLSVPLGGIGSLSIEPSMESAVKEADYIQESVSERLEIKQSVYQDIELHCRADALIGSSTSNLKPSVLQQSLVRPSRMLVVHPFNPVYLLPLAEVVAGEETDGDVVDRTMALLRSIGMKPVRLRREMDAHIGNRFLEAIWRESLWLVKEGVATTEELDDVITYGFGLRFAQMGQFQSYLLAGGEGGMRHFVSQFGPTLSWPLTRLTDVPDLDEQLVERIVEQCEDQCGDMPLRDLERQRDRNIVGILRSLKENDWGAGQMVKSLEQGLSKGLQAKTTPA